MSQCKLDHLVVAAASLEVGSEYVEDLLGVKTEAGGRHESNATHNRLLRLGADQYLEVIAIDPQATPPPRPRWFALDDPGMRRAIEAGPRLITWVARTTDLDAAAARDPYREMEIRELERGDLRWRMTFTADGALPGGGALALLIEWQTGFMPPERLPDAGCALAGFEIRTPQATSVTGVIDDLGLDSVTVGEAAQTELVATLRTPRRGEVRLSSLASADT